MVNRFWIVDVLDRFADHFKIRVRFDDEWKFEIWDTLQSHNDSLENLFHLVHFIST